MLRAHLGKYLPIVTRRVLESFISVYAKFTRVLPAQMAGHLFLEKFWLETVASKNHKMHTRMKAETQPHRKLCMHICVRVVWWIGCVVVSMFDVVSMMFSVACGEYTLMWGVPYCGVVCLLW